MTQDSRTEFEAKFPPPKGVTWGAGIGKYFTSQFCDDPFAIIYQRQFEVWQAAKASESARQAEAEPAAWMTEIFEYDPPARCTHSRAESAQHYQEGAGGPERCRIVPLYTTTPVVPEGKLLFPVKAWEFLRGVGPLDGVHFGEKHPERKGNFWWRSYIREMLSSPQPAEQEQTRETRQAVERLARDNVIVRSCVDMHRYRKTPWAECMEIAVAALAESESHLKEIAIQAAMNQPAHTIVGKIVEGE